MFKFGLKELMACTASWLVLAMVWRFLEVTGLGMVRPSDNLPLWLVVGLGAMALGISTPIVYLILVEPKKKGKKK